MGNQPSTHINETWLKGLSDVVKIKLLVLLQWDQHRAWSLEYQWHSLAYQTMISSVSAWPSTFEISNYR